MGDWEGAFKLAIPVEAARMTASTQCTRDSKIVWRLELTFDHKPIPYVGTRITRSHLLNIKSYLSPPVSPPTPLPAVVVPGAMIHVRTPVGAYGPGDTFRLEFDVVPDDSNTTVRKGLVQLDRRSEPLAMSPDVSLAMPPKQALEVRKHRPREKRSFFRRSRSTSADTSPSPVMPYEKLDDEIPSPPPTAQTPPTVVRSSVMEILTPDPVVSSSGFSFVATGTIPRRSHKWDAGETGRTRLLATSFELRIRFALKTKKSPSKEIVCPPIPIVLVGSSQEERETAQAVIAESTAASGKLKAGHPAKKRHRSSRRGLYMQEGTIEISDPVVATSAPHDSPHKRTSPPPHSTSELAPDESAGTLRPPLSERVSTGVKPILLRPQEATSSAAPVQGISFALPSRMDAADAALLAPDAPPPADIPSPVRQGGLNIHELIHPTFNNASPFSPKPSDAALTFAPLASRYAPIPHIGRRISTTTSEEEDAQPCRSRPRRTGHSAHSEHGSPSSFAWNGTDIKMTVTPATMTMPSTPILPLPPDSSITRPCLPSLDTLGLGLPKVPEYDRTPRPRTAPSVSIFPNSAWNNIRSTADDDAPRPVTSAGFGLGLHGGGSSVNVATSNLEPSRANDGRSRVFGSATAMSSATSFGSTRDLLPQWDHRSASRDTNGPPAYTPTAPPDAVQSSRSSSRTRAPAMHADTGSRKTMTTVVPVPGGDRERDQGYRVGAGSFAPAISQQQQIQQALAAEQRNQQSQMSGTMGSAVERDPAHAPAHAPAPAPRRRSSVFGLGGRGFGRTEEGSFAFGLKG